MSSILSRRLVGYSATTLTAMMHSGPASQPGTVSGAPKIRAMQIIDDQEPGHRGLYAGAVGYIGFDRNLDFAIAIRTIQVKNGLASVQVGAGIVADSVPENEWKETENKAAAMLRAIEKSGAGP